MIVEEVGVVFVFENGFWCVVDCIECWYDFDCFLFFVDLVIVELGFFNDYGDGKLFYGVFWEICFFSIV